MKTGLVALSLVFLCACSAVRVVPYEQLNALESEQTVRFFYPSAGSANVEAYLVRPQGHGPFPLVILLHGHSLVGRGAEQVLPTAEALAKENCFVGLAISLPGYGATKSIEGPVEETTRQVVKDGLSMATKLSWVDSNHIMFYGVSRGAIIAAALLSEVGGLSGAVLYSGAYDLGMLYRETQSYWVRKMLNPNDEVNPTLLNVLGEASKWHAPTLILHGAQDNLIPVDQALSLRDQLKAAGIPYRLVLYPNNGHFLPRASVRELTVNFLRETNAPACPFGGRS
jgi:dipeptidyl aminopeptidase/acylaminoacyl peptidase